MCWDEEQGPGHLAFYTVQQGLCIYSEQVRNSLVDSGYGEIWYGFKGRSCETMAVVLERDAEGLPQESSSGG